MPLSDQDVTSVMDWLGRSQPVAQQQLALSTATGGAPAGGPVTPGGGLVTPTQPGVSPSGRQGGATGGGASPLGQAVGVADLVRRAAGLIPGGAAEVPGALGGPGAFGAQIEAEGGAQGLRTLGTTTGGLEGGLEAGITAPGAEQAAQLGAQGLGDIPAGGVEAGTTGLGAIGTGVGGAAGLAFGIKSALDAQTDVGKAGGAISSVGGALALASLVQPELLPFAIAVSLLGGGTSIFGSLFGGKPQLTHAQREQKELGGKLRPAAGSFESDIQGAPTLDALWQTLVSHQSGSVGGTSPVATGIYLEDSPPYAPQAPVIGEGASKAAIQSLIDTGDIVLPPGYGTKYDQYLRDTGHAATFTMIPPGVQNPLYPVWTQEGFFRAFSGDPSRVRAGVQAGVTPALLDPLNQAIRQVLEQKIGTFGDPQPGTMTDPGAPRLQRSGGDSGSPTFGASPVGGGPSGALGFAQDLLQAA